MKMGGQQDQTNKKKSEKLYYKIKKKNNDQIHNIKLMWQHGHKTNEVNKNSQTETNKTKNLRNYAASCVKTSGVKISRN